MELQALCLNTNATNVAFMRHLHRRPTSALTFTPRPLCLPKQCALAARHVHTAE